MHRKHLNLVFPQWQGSWPDRSTYEGAYDIIARYFTGRPCTVVPVAPEGEGLVENNIADYRAILLQLERAKSMIEQAAPDTLFSIGGGCDADVTSIAYLNRKLKGNLTLLWLDSHADLNIPETSASKLFFGMPVRTLLGEGDPAILHLLDNRLDLSQIVQIGVRDIDPPEREYIDAVRIRELSVEDVERDLEIVIETIRAMGKDNLYIHIDLDVLEPALFPWVPLPVSGGLAPSTMALLLRRLSEEFTIPGVGLYEYMPAAAARVELLEEIVSLGTSLAKE